MPTCIYSKEHFDTASAEHVLQNFLGARWASSEIVSDKVQSDFGVTIDKDLENGLLPVRNLLGTEGGRGEPGPRLEDLQTPSGRVIDLNPGGKPRLAEPFLKVTEMEGKTQIQIEAADAGQLEWALARLREEHPNLKVDESVARQSARPVSAPLGEKVKIEFNIGGIDYFRGALKSCFNLLGVRNPAVALSASCDPIRDFILKGTGKSDDFARWIPPGFVAQWPNRGQADHFIGLTTANGGIQGIVQFFGNIRHSIRLSEAYDGPPFAYSYVVDPFRQAEPAENREAALEEGDIPKFESQLLEPNDEILKTFREGILNVYLLHLQAANAELIDRVMKEVWGPPPWEFITPEMQNRLARRLAEEVVRQLPAPPIR